MAEKPDRIGPRAASPRGDYGAADATRCRVELTESGEHEKTVGAVPR